MEFRPSGRSPVAARRRSLRRRLRRAAARAYGLGCRPGDIRLAYGWRSTVAVAAAVGIGLAVAARALLSWAFVALVSPSVTGLAVFNAVVTACTVLVALARARSIGRVALRKLPAWRRRTDRWGRRVRHRLRRRVAGVARGLRRRCRRRGRRVGWWWGRWCRDRQRALTRYRAAPSRRR